MTLAFRPALRRDVHRIATNMARIDALECSASGWSPKAALRMAMASSVESWTGLIDGRPEAMFGVQALSLVDSVGAPWFLGTDRSRSVRKAFLTIAPTIISRFHGAFDTLENHVHADNRAAILWLARLGFALESETVDIGGQPMRRFWREKPDVRPGDTLDGNGGGDRGRSHAV